MRAMMNLAENRNLARFMYSDWHPQVFLTMHQMEDNGPRFFVPPNTDPIDPNSDPLIWRSAALLGGAMAMELQREGKSGVITSAKYDYYWPGFEDSAPIGHNTVCLLTEVASVDVASPVNVPATELRAGFKGLQDYRPQINFPDPWPGGRWTLRNILDYDLTAARGLLVAASAYREQLIQNFYDMASVRASSSPTMWGSARRCRRCSPSRSSAHAESRHECSSSAPQVCASSGRRRRRIDLVCRSPSSITRECGEPARSCQPG